MKTLCIIIGVIFLTILAAAKPFDDNRSFSNENRFPCIDANKDLDSEGNYNIESFQNTYNHQSQSDGIEKYPNKRFDNFRELTSENFADNFENPPLQKRQVGVVYDNDNPVGILQPYQRSYRFIPVKGEDEFDEDVDLISSMPNIVPDASKREARGFSLGLTYPSILTNFKIDSKLDRKRNYNIFNDDNIQELKTTIRHLRSSNSHNSRQIEEKLKNILVDMGLIGDEEVRPDKRETKDEQLGEESDDDANFAENRNKRDEGCIHSNNENADPHTRQIPQKFSSNIDGNIFDASCGVSTVVNKRKDKDESETSRRKKRQKQVIKSDFNKEDSTKISGNLKYSATDADNSLSGKKKYDEDNDAYEGRVERQIENKINSLKNEVERKIEAMKKRQTETVDEDMQRKKRQVLNNLMEEETDELNPAVNVEQNLKPLIRKRRQVHLIKRERTERQKRENKSRESVKKRSEYSRNMQPSDDTLEGGELLGDDEITEGSIHKRQIYSSIGKQGNNQNNENFNGGRLMAHQNYCKNYFRGNIRLKRQNSFSPLNQILANRANSFISPEKRFRLRRRINDNEKMANRPQQLSDMSDLDLFGALPKSYSGELSRYKRVR